MDSVLWCNLCQEQPASGALTGYFEGYEDDQTTLMVCETCAKAALARK